jgi:RNA 3'-terminal phosphate cyclase (ATP)
MGLTGFDSRTGDPHIAGSLASGCHRISLLAMANELIIDGAAGEGGGQILRSALALSLVTGRPFRIERIRAGRRKPGILRQHLTAVEAAVQVGRARVTGAEIGSQTLTFEPGETRGGEFQLAVGTAGSATLVLQAVLPALLAAREPSRLTLEGGTHNPSAPPFDFLAGAFLPLLRRMGASVSVELERHGFYPAGGGRFSVTIEPASSRTRLDLLERGDTQISARAIVAALPDTIAKRELKVVTRRFGLDRERSRIEVIPGAIGPGNAVMIAIAMASHTEIVTGFGEKGVPADEVASHACDEAEAFLKSSATVGVRLADQLLLPLALGCGGSFRTPEATPHTLTNADVIRQFLGTPVAIERGADGTSLIQVDGRK